MKPLLILGTLGAIGGAVLSVMIRTSLKDARLQKDELNRATVVLHDEIREQSKAIAETYATYSETQKNAKNEDLQAKALVTETKGKEEDLAGVKKEIDDIGAKNRPCRKKSPASSAALEPPKSFWPKTKR